MNLNRLLGFIPSDPGIDNLYGGCDLIRSNQLSTWYET